VHWLRARAQLHRWKEEYDVTSREMVWTVLYFIFQRNKWQLRRQQQMTPTPSIGKIAYCEKQMHLWEELGRVANMQFANARETYPSDTWRPAV